jgi:hypothetical protein
MTLLTRHIEAGWHETEWNPSAKRFSAEKSHAQPGATSTVLREEAASQDELHRKLDLRESQLSNDPAHVIHPDGSRVTDAEHSALRLLGTDPVSLPAPNGPTTEEQEAIAAASAAATPSEPTVDTSVDPATPTVPFVIKREWNDSSPLSDEERAKLRSDEDELEDGKVDGIEPPIPPEQLVG